MSCPNFLMQDKDFGAKSVSTGAAGRRVSRASQSGREPLRAPSRRRFAQVSPLEPSRTLSRIEPDVCDTTIISSRDHLEPRRATSIQISRLFMGSSAVDPRRLPVFSLHLLLPGLYRCYLSLHAGTSRRVRRASPACSGAGSGDGARRSCVRGKWLTGL